MRFSDKAKCLLASQVKPIEQNRVPFDRKRVGRKALQDSRQARKRLSCGSDGLALFVRHRQETVVHSQTKVHRRLRRKKQQFVLVNQYWDNHARTPISILLFWIQTGHWKAALM